VLVIALIAVLVYYFKRDVMLNQMDAIKMHLLSGAARHL
jgi:hypothetical protein